MGVLSFLVGGFAAVYGLEGHAADWAVSWFILDDLGVHWAGVFSWSIHRGYSGGLRCYLNVNLPLWKVANDPFI